MLISLIEILGLIAACTGAGALVLVTLGQWTHRPQLERSLLGFAVGFGSVGWLFFWLGVSIGFSQPALLTVLGIMTSGCFCFLLPSAPHRGRFKPSAIDWALIAIATTAFGLDFLEALAPPVEADSLAYHFDLARRFSEAGKIYFVPRAMDGAVPLLVQMTYVVAYSVGGELTLTLWAFVTGWCAAALLFVLSRKWLGFSWSLAIACLFQTLPAMLYGAGSGQIEARLAVFVMVVVFGLLECRTSNQIRAAVLIGLGAGFYAGSKYTGLLFVAAAGVTLLFLGAGWFRRSLVFGTAVLVAGGQWYAWNFIHTGDPVFPVFFALLQLPSSAYWDSGYAADFQAIMELRAESINWWERWLAYPVIATLFPPFAVEAGRVGLGPLFLMMIPMSVCGFWHFRHRIWRSQLGPIALLVVLFYILWLKFGGIPKVRHLIPLIPPLILCLSVAAERWCRKFGSLSPLKLSLILALSLNFAAAGLFSRPYVDFLISGSDRESFLRSNVRDYDAVAWLNKNESPARIAALQRHYIYYLNAPAFFVFPHVQKIVEARPAELTPNLFFDNLRAGGFTHIIGHRSPNGIANPGTRAWAIEILENSDCLTTIGEFPTTWQHSRTLRGLATSQQTTAVQRIDETECQYQSQK